MGLRCSSSESSESEAGSREKSSREAGSEGEVIMSGEKVGSVDEVVEASVVVETVTLLLVRLRRVGRFGVDFDWKPEGTGGGLRCLPLLCGGILQV